MLNNPALIILCDAIRSVLEDMEPGRAFQANAEGFKAGLRSRLGEAVERGRNASERIEVYATWAYITEDMSIDDAIESAKDNVRREGYSFI